ncbi:hypothetical protein ACWPKO_02835 [Coraliomargarita sp. W4R53]
MKIKQYITAILFSLSLVAVSQSAHAAEAAGPNGGRVIEKIQPSAEFFLTPDRYAQITFLDAEGVAIAPEQQTVTLIGGDRSAPVTHTFERVGDVLRSVEPLADQPKMPIILSIKSSPDAKTVRERFYLNQHVCGGCQLEEYACICGH